MSSGVTLACMVANRMLFEDDKEFDERVASLPSLAPSDVAAIGDSYCAYIGWPSLVGIPSSQVFSVGGASVHDFVHGGKHYEMTRAVTHLACKAVIVSACGADIVRAITSGNVGTAVAPAVGAYLRLLDELEGSGKTVYGFTYSGWALFGTLPLWQCIYGQIYVNSTLNKAHAEAGVETIPLKQITGYGDYNKDDIHLSGKGHAKVAKWVKSNVLGV